MKYEVGDEVYVFQDTQSAIMDIFGYGVIVEMKNFVQGDERHRVQYYPNNIIRSSEYKLWVHPNDMRKVTKLDRILK